MQKVRVVDTCVIRAVSLEYEYTCNSGDFGNDAILSTCDSFVCGGQVEPTAETDNIVVSYTLGAGITCVFDLQLRSLPYHSANVIQLRLDKSVSCVQDSCLCSSHIKTLMVSQKGWQCPKHFFMSSVLMLNASKLASATLWQVTQSWQAGWARQQDQASLVYS